MSWFVTTAELERKGARLLLLNLRKLEAANAALQSLEQGTSLDKIGYMGSAKISSMRSPNKKIGLANFNVTWHRRKICVRVIKFVPSTGTLIPYTSKWQRWRRRCRKSFNR